MANDGPDVCTGESSCVLLAFASNTQKLTQVQVPESLTTHGATTVMFGGVDGPVTIHLPEDHRAQVKVPTPGRVGETKPVETGSTGTAEPVEENVSTQTNTTRGVTNLWKQASLMHSKVWKGRPASVLS